MPSRNGEVHCAIFWDNICPVWTHKRASQIVFTAILLMFTLAGAGCDFNRWRYVGIVHSPMDVKQTIPVDCILTKDEQQIAWNQVIKEGTVNGSPAVMMGENDALNEQIQWKDMTIFFGTKQGTLFSVGEHNLYLRKGDRRYWIYWARMRGAGEMMSANVQERLQQAGIWESLERVEIDKPGEAAFHQLIAAKPTHFTRLTLDERSENYKKEQTLLQSHSGLTSLLQSYEQMHQREKALISHLCISDVPIE